MTKDEFKQKHAAEMDAPITMGVLLESYDHFLIPAMSDMMDDKIKASEGRMDQKLKESNAGLENRLKSYIDDKLGEYTSEIFKRLEKTFQKDTAFKSKLIQLLRTHNIGTSEEIAFLEGMVFQG